jgi:DNA-binding transcriptional MocR family regulator
MRASLPEGGFVLWIQLPAGYDGHEVQQLAASIGINILPGAVFSPSGQYKNCIRLNCGHPIEILEPAIEALAALL